MTEAERQARIMLAVGALPGVRLFRNTVGEGWTGKQVQGPKDLVILRNASRVAFGLQPGSHDLIGWRSTLITQQMVGTKIAVFLGGEIKTHTGKLSAEQRNFHDNLVAAGGMSGIWITPEDAINTVADRPGDVSTWRRNEVT